jgi:hypothetical protein
MSAALNVVNDAIFIAPDVVTVRDRLPIKIREGSGNSAIFKKSAGKKRSFPVRLISAILVSS